MKILLLYFMLAFLGLSIIVTVDLLLGLSVAGSFQSIQSSFAVTGIQESIIMVVFLSLPFIDVITTFLKNKNKQANK